MLDFIQNQILFYASIAIIFFVPGYFLLLAIFGQSRAVSSLEKFVLAPGLSIVSLNFIYFAFDALKIPFTRNSTFWGLIIFSIICYLIYRLKTFCWTQTNEAGREETSALFSFSKNEFRLVLFLIFAMFFFKFIYLSGSVSPSATDMGHHLYWTKWLTENRQLPGYDGMPDFIIGEHTAFGALAMLSGADFFSAYPAVTLNLVNLLGILAVFVLTLRIFKNKTISILALFFLGTLFAVAAPQSKFVSGGVFGNILGNFLMPLALYFYFRALSALERKSEENITVNDSRKFLSLAVFMTFGIFYTHHLTAFVFLFVFLFFIAIFLLFNLGQIKHIFRQAAKLFLSSSVLAVFLGGLICFFLVFTPTYAQKSAVDTAVGSPSKSTRAGLTLAELNNSMGGARLALGLFGLFALFALRKKANIGHVMIGAWAAILFLLSTAPHLLFINLPSNRVGSYLSYPLAILSAAGFYFIFAGKTQSHFLIKAGFLIILGFSLTQGISDLAGAVSGKSNYPELAQTFAASQYLAEKTSQEDKIIKDHNYITGDSWMKLFFMRGYRYPESRGYFKRYEDPTKPREMCTLHMISNPGGPEAQECFAELGTNFFVVNPAFDGAQFEKLGNFDRVYANQQATVFYRK